MLAVLLQSPCFTTAYIHEGSMPTLLLNVTQTGINGNFI